MPPKRARAAPQTSEPVQPPKRDSVAVPSEYLCPISEELMRDPVVCADGFTFDRPSIELWFSEGHHSNPVTGARLPHSNLVPNLVLRKLVEDCARRRLQRRLDLLKAAAEERAMWVNLVIQNSRTSELEHFKVKRSIQCRIIFSEFCQRQNCDVRAVRFLFDSATIRPDCTPDELDMEDSDIIDAMFCEVGSIGIFVCNESIVCNNGITLPATSAPGAQWLMRPSLPRTLPSLEAVAAVVAALNGSSSARPPALHSTPAFSCISLDACTVLRARVDRAHLAFTASKTSATSPCAAKNNVADAVVSNSCASDFRCVLHSDNQLTRLVFTDTCTQDAAQSAAAAGNHRQRCVCAHPVRSRDRVA
jgi:hypothetical protein